MNTTLKLVLAALLTTTAACTAEAADGSAPSSDEQAIATSTATGGLEMYIGYEVRGELADALGQVEGEFDFRDVTVPGVLRAQHQYSVAALRLEVANWALVTGLTPPAVGSWGIDSALGISFPNWRSGNDDPGFAESAAAAKKLFEALTNAEETSETVATGVVETTRRSAHGSFSCTKTVRAGGGGASFHCLVAGVGQVGSTGLIWDWATANEKAEQQNAANTK